MFTALLLMAVFSISGLRGSSRAISYDHHPRAVDLDQSQCICPDTRSILDIIWSCLSTIFLCTWVAMHPNMPPKGERAIKTFGRRMKMMVAAIVGPEFVLMFSMRQWMTARATAKMYKDRKWTSTRGFFLIMGGFVLMKGDEDLGTISRDLLHELDEAGEIEFPSVTKEEIEDKSKGDMLSKGLVILQTLWFVIQCIARGVQGLAVTELEVFTLAFCSLNAIMYYMWWYKPLDVQCRIPVFLKPESNYDHKRTLTRASEIDDADRALRDIERALEAEPAEPSSVDFVNMSVLAYLAHRICFPLQKVGKEVKRAYGECSFRIRRLWRKHSKTVNVYLLAPLWLICALPAAIVVTMRYWFVMLTELLGEGIEPLPAGVNRVNTFYSPDEFSPGEVDGPVLIPVSILVIVTSIFGGLHLIAWSFYFPTHTETLIWRYISLYMTIFPVTFLIDTFVESSLCLDYFSGESQHEGLMGTRTVYNLLYGSYVAVVSLMFICVLAYLPARLVLLVEAFISLRQLPPDALLDIDWNNFIPHF